MSAPPHGPAVVTGASGFIGSHLLARLVRDGCSVVGLDAPSPIPPQRRRLRKQRC